MASFTVVGMFIGFQVLFISLCVWGKGMQKQPTCCYHTEGRAVPSDKYDALELTITLARRSSTSAIALVVCGGACAKGQMHRMFRCHKYLHIHAACILL